MITQNELKRIIDQINDGFQGHIESMVALEARVVSLEKQDKGCACNKAPTKTATRANNKA